jgi:p-aminobenzoyl-glutamate transporter AbgT
VASLFINAFDKSNIGLVLVSWLTNLINSFNFSGVGLVLLLFIIVIGKTLKLWIRHMLNL